MSGAFGCCVAFVLYISAAAASCGQLSANAAALLRVLWALAASSPTGCGFSHSYLDQLGS